jgi:hypothetical protein
MMYISTHVLLRYIRSCTMECHLQCAGKMLESFRRLYGREEGFSKCYDALYAAQLLVSIRVAIVSCITVSEFYKVNESCHW